jgi:hypothetical protein
MSYFRLAGGDQQAHPPTLVIGYAEQSEPAIRAGMRELAAAVGATRARAPAQDE